MDHGQQNLPLPGPRISRVTLARLHNLGNYEHVRYEVTVELPPGTSPSSVVRELEDTLTALEPKQPVSNYELGQAVHLLSKPVPTLQDMQRQDDEDPFDSTTPAQALERALADRARAERLLKRHGDWKTARDAALQRFDRLGGVEVFTDAKDRWEDN
jgi:hypothetical protein